MSNNRSESLAYTTEKENKTSGRTSQWLFTVYLQKQLPKKVYSIKIILATINKQHDEIERNLGMISFPIFAVAIPKNK